MRVQTIEQAGQAIWLDDISRDWLSPGGFLEDMIQKNHAYGLTTNPSIFAKALSNDDLYAKDLQAGSQSGDATTLLWTVMKEDIAKACDIFRPLYDQSNGLHGYVSIEIDPTKAHDAQGTIHDGLAPWRELNKPNVMIKVPATKSGLTAIETLTEEGVNVNATLLFSVARYEEVLHAYVRGLQTRVKQGKPIDSIQSVASFFISRLDALVDPTLQPTHPDLVGTAAVANAKAAYRVQTTHEKTDEWAALVAHGANVQRLLWASTSVKDPSFPDTKYIDELIAPNTVNTVPLATLQAVIDHGLTTRFPEHSENDTSALDALRAANIDLDKAALELETNGIAAFIKDYESAVNLVEQAIENA